MGRLKEAFARLRREKEAETWRRDLMHYCRNSGEYLERQRQMLHKYHPGENYIGMISFGDHGQKTCSYQLLPADIYSHRVNVVYLNIRVNNYSELKIPSEYFHCVRCKLMGTVKTLQEYTCV